MSKPSTIVAIVETLPGDWVELQQQRRVNAAATANIFMNYTSVDRSRMVSHIIPVSGVSRYNKNRLKNFCEFK